MSDLKKELLKMQEKTHVDKKVNKNTAKKIITQNSSNIWKKKNSNH